MQSGYRNRQPEDLSIDVCRYIELAGLVSLLSSKKLHFSRIGLLQDQFEGTPPKLHRHKIIEGFSQDIEAARKHARALGIDPESKSPEEVADQAIEILRERREKIHASCWYYDAYESEAMWRIYCPSGPGVAIVLPYHVLKESLRNLVDRCGLVEYIDYSIDDVPINSAPVDLAMYKRRHFSHEKEVRCVKQPRVPPDTLDLPWDPEKFLSKIIISPYAQEWQAEAIRTCVKAFAPSLSSKLQTSAMASPPA